MNQFRSSDDETPRCNGAGRRMGLLALAAILVFSTGLSAQKTRSGVAAKPAAPTNPPNQPALEPAALNALRAMSSQLQAVNSFSFTARIMREEPGTNGQMLDFFKYITVQVQRPDKMRLQVQSDTSDVNLWYDGKNVTLMPVLGKAYTVLPAPGTIDATLTMLKDKLQAHTPLRPFLSSDPYAILSDGLQSANEVGFENMGNSQFLHLAFREPDADWQLWLSGPNQVLPRRLAVIYRNVEGQPRVDIDFSNWCLNAEIPGGAFVFSKPAGALQANWNAVKPKAAAAEGGKTQ
jgi:hypothetical protein